jgi:hypothetical protein
MPSIAIKISIEVLMVEIEAAPELPDDTPLRLPARI